LNTAISINPHEHESVRHSLGPLCRKMLTTSRGKVFASQSLVQLPFAIKPSMPQELPSFHRKTRSIPICPGTPAQKTIPFNGTSHSVRAVHGHHINKVVLLFLCTREGNVSMCGAQFLPTGLQSKFTNATARELKGGFSPVAPLVPMSVLPTPISVSMPVQVRRSTSG